VPGKQILVVDDHVDTLEVLTRLLKSLGYAVKNATSVQEALQHASASSFDLLISDLTLPDGNGADLAKQICASRQIPAIALSGFTPGDEDKISADSEFKARLVKPVDFQLLQETIQKLLPD
jgi:CheY-like chemotaxis protein